MSDQDRSTAWFLAQCKPNSYRIAESNLMRQGFRTFLPLQEETRRVRSKFVTQLRPLFPGYLFVALDKQRGDLRFVNSTYGITREYRKVWGNCRRQPLMARSVHGCDR